MVTEKFVAEARVRRSHQMLLVLRGGSSRRWIVVGQFDNVYGQFTYDRQPFSMVPTGYGAGAYIGVGLTLTSLAEIGYMPLQRT